MSWVLINGTMREWREWRRKSRLTNKEVREILTWCHKRVIVRDLSYEYGVSPTTICRIRDGLSHREVFNSFYGLRNL